MVHTRATARLRLEPVAPYGLVRRRRAGQRGIGVLGADLGPRGRRLFAALSVLWGLSILYSTLATKQHWLADLPPAFLLAFLSDRYAWRSSASARTAN